MTPTAMYRAAVAERRSADKAEQEAKGVAAATAAAHEAAKVTLPKGDPTRIELFEARQAAKAAADAAFWRANSARQAAIATQSAAEEADPVGAAEVYAEDLRCAALEMIAELDAAALQDEYSWSVARNRATRAIADAVSAGCCNDEQELWSLLRAAAPAAAARLREEAADRQAAHNSRAAEGSYRSTGWLAG